LRFAQEGVLNDVPEIDIVVPTYNASLWLDDLVQSILSQESPYSFRLIVRDDASTDDTAEKLLRWQDRLGDRMTILPSERNLGMVGNFEALFAAPSAPWVMLADPDDVWEPGKILAIVSAMRGAESENGAECPIAVFTDARVVDSNLLPICESYWRWMRQDPNLSQVFSRMVLDNPALTSTMMVNRALLSLALPMSGAAVYPDWWLAHTACCFGKLVFLRERTVKYRRHSANDSAVPATATLSQALMKLGRARSRVRGLIGQSALHAKGFLDHYGPRIPDEQVAILQAAMNLLTKSFMRRRYDLIRYNLWFGSPIKNVVLMLLL
jgi:glycosyltransferase involved in cell wall biosynthesis